MTTTTVDTNSDRKKVAAAKVLNRPAERALLLGVIFSFLFTALIWVTGPRLDVFPHLPDQGASWYYWKLPQPDLMARLTAWVFYLSHQVIMWGLIWYAQTRVKKYAPAGGLHRVNIIALAVNALYIVLHYIQTHVWYDALAQDTSIWASQWSVIILLVWIMLMENNRRGVFFGKKLPIGKAIIEFARKYHGYYFAWAITFTFWFHPMEYTEGHLLGFFYTFLLMLQGSLFLTRIHVNKWWMFVQEIVVLAHGTIVAIVGGQPMWTMFFFGFFGVFIITQLHGLGLNRRVKWGFYALYIVSALAIYGSRGFTRVWELAAIPVADYAILIIMALLFGAGIRIYRWVNNRWLNNGGNTNSDRGSMQPAGTD